MSPRVANALLRRVRDYAQAIDVALVNGDVALAGLDVFEIDEFGLDSLGREILEALVVKFNGGPVGITTLAASVNEAVSTLETYEPFFMSLGMIARTPRGRVAMPKAYEHLGIAIPAASTAQMYLAANTQGDLFGQETGGDSPNASGTNE
jgi:Holliday junction DNA helicase RuvB